MYGGWGRCLQGTGNIGRRKFPLVAGVVFEYCIPVVFEYCITIMNNFVSYDDFIKNIFLSQDKRSERWAAGLEHVLHA